MAKTCHSISKLISTNPPPSPKYKTFLESPSLNKNPSLCCSSRFQVSSRKEEFPQYLKGNSRRNPRPPRRLITISTSDGKWHGQWTRDFVFTLEELQLADLVEAGERNTEVAISLLIQKHAGFGFSVDGRITTAFTRKCINCFSSYCKEINTTFDVWLLPSIKDGHSLQLPEIGGDDPSVIYVKPGCEADLDSLIQDTVRLATSVKETCSDSCEKSTPKWHYIGGKETYVDTRWSRLLEIKTTRM